MQPEIADRLLEINHLFYQNFAGSFSATRRRLQPGVWRILETLPQEARLLDLGCGNGELARELSQRSQRGSYLGLDFSPGLLEDARQAVRAAPSPGFTVDFRLADLASPAWAQALPGQDQDYDTVLAFAVLHHLPGEALRLRLLRQVRGLLAARQGLFIHSEWQFLSSPRLARRVLPWETAGLEPGAVDPGDYLLDWRADGQGLRYVHQCNEAELQALAAGSGFTVRETFYSDGEGGRLSLYQVWQVSEDGLN